VDTLPKLIKRNYERWPDRTAMAMKNFGIWQRYTWKDYYERVKYFCLGLISLGLEPGDKVCIIGDNEPEWFWGEFAVQAAGGIPTGIFVDSIPPEVKYITEHSESKFAIVNDQEQTDKFLQIKNELPLLKKIIYWDPKGLAHYDDPLIISFAKVMELGREYERTHPGLFEELVEKGRGDDPAFIYYTSGTTGLPKGAAITHRALINTAESFLKRFPLNEKDEVMSNFPAPWVGDSFFSTVPHLLTGARLNFPEEPETIAEDTREVGPSFVVYGPRQWEGIVSDIQVRMMDASLLKRFWYRVMLPVGYKLADMRFAGKSPNLFWRVLHLIAEWTVFRPLKDRIGLSCLKYAGTGSSVLSLDTFKLLNALGIELRQMYASTEGGSISFHGERENDFETIGRPALGVEVRVDDKGEALIRSSCVFKEYHRDPEKTAEALKDGWFYTGDAIYINDFGHLVFLDRMKDMGRLKGGAVYVPQYIEGRLRFSPYIKDAMVVGGEDREYVTAIVNIDFEMVGKWAEDHRVPYTTYVDLSQKKEVADLIQKDLVRVNGYLPPESRVKKFVLLHKEFDPDEAELTRTRKLRRDFMEQRYKELIEAMYSGKEEVRLEAPVTYRDGRKGVVTATIKVRTIE